MAPKALVVQGRGRGGRGRMTILAEVRAWAREGWSEDRVRGALHRRGYSCARRNELIRAFRRIREIMRIMADYNDRVAEEHYVP